MGRTREVMGREQGQNALANAGKCHKEIHLMPNYYMLMINMKNQLEHKALLMTEIAVNLSLLTIIHF